MFCFSPLWYFQTHILNGAFTLFIEFRLELLPFQKTYVSNVEGSVDNVCRMLKSNHLESSDAQTMILSLAGMV